MNLRPLNFWPINYLSWFGTLAVAPLSRSVSGASGQTQFQITSNRAWTVSSDSEWAVPDKTNGSGNDTVTITYAKNTAWMPREAVITVSSPRTRPASVEVDIMQAQLIPNVLGLTEAVAIETMVEAGYSLWPSETYYHPCIPAGIVIAQSPVGSTPGMPGDIVTITVSLGRAPAIVPDVVGLHFSLAAAAIDAAGFVPEVETAFSADVAPGYVVSQDPEADTVLLEGDSVNIIISLGEDFVEIPDVQGMEKTDAESLLISIGVSVYLTYTYSEEIEENFVISQVPAPETLVYPESLVALLISLGEEPKTTVPNLKNKTEIEAKNALLTANLNFSMNYAFDDDIEEGRVISQTVTPGITVPFGTVIGFTLSLGSISDLNYSPAQAVADYLETIFEIPIFVGTEPATPHECLTIFDTEGEITQTHNRNIWEIPRLQIRVRGLNYNTTYATMMSVQKSLMLKDPFIHKMHIYKGFVLFGSPYYLGLDETRRATWSLNFRVFREEIEEDE